MKKNIIRLSVFALVYGLLVVPMVSKQASASSVESGKYRVELDEIISKDLEDMKLSQMGRPQKTKYCSLMSKARAAGARARSRKA